MDNTENTLTGIMAELNRLVTEWSREGYFLDNEDDDPQDRAIGRTYKECAKELKALIGG